MLFSPDPLRMQYGIDPTSSPCAACRLISRSMSFWLHSRLQHARQLAEESVRASAAHPSCVCSAHSRLWLATALTYLRELDRAEELLYPKDPDAFHGSAETAARLHLSRSLLAFTNGDVGTSAQLGEQGLAGAGRPGPWRTLGQLVLAGCALRRADMRVALTYTQRIAEDTLIASSNPLAGQCAWVSVQVREAHDGAEEVVPFIEQLVSLEPTSREVLSSQPAAAPWFVRLALKAGDKAVARQGALAARQLAVINPEFRSLSAAALHTKGLIERNLDDLWQAAEMHVDPWARASALEDIGTHLTGHRLQRDRAIEILERSSDIYLAAGASRDLSRVKSRLRSLGVRHHISRWSHSANGSKGQVGLLTETEFAVAQLVVQGMTNSQVAAQLFLSHHTVAFHLKKIFRKVDVSSRVELARTWRTPVGKNRPRSS
ncbi:MULTISPECIES: LuxR C-terminal-related transcriptional regulator [unclassified Streptomyces]|uniref:helix-turn-helix transcriptional regulator n=1 Tax=unclassified Streptomyces TaxID=2593676 RepID=UPI003816B8D4